MKYFNKSLVIFCLSACLLNDANAQQSSTKIPLTISQIWQKVSDNSKAIQMQGIRVLGTAEEIRDARNERLPEISATGEYGQLSNVPIYEKGLFHQPEQFEGIIHTSYKFGGDIYMNLYSGGKTTLKIAQAKKENEIALEQKNLTTADMKLRSAVHYLDLQISIIFKNLLLKDISTQEKQLEEIMQLQKNGVVLKSDVLRASLKLSRQKMSLVQLDNDLAIANQQLNILCGMPDEAVIEPVEEEDSAGLPALKHYSEYLEEAMENSYSQKISEKEGQLTKLQIKSVKANVSFKLGLFANYNYSYPEVLLYPYSSSVYGLGMVGLKASFPISSFYHNIHKSRAAELKYELHEVEHSAISDKIRQEVNAAFLRYKESLTRIGVAQENIDQASENLRIVKNTYFNQLSLLTDLLDADTQLLQTRFDYAAARIAAKLQYYQLQKALGNL